MRYAPPNRHRYRYRNVVNVGSPPKWRRKNLHGVRLSAPRVHDHLRLRSVRRVHRE